MRADQNSSPQQHSEERTFRPKWVEQFLYSAAILVIFIAVDQLSGLNRPEGTSSGAGVVYVVALFGIWLVALPALQYALIRWHTGARPRLGWSSSRNPNVFGLLNAPGARFGRNAFALVCALPVLCVALMLLPLASLAWIQGVEIVPEVVLVVAGGISLYLLRYSLWALSRSQGTLIEVLGEDGIVYAFQ